MFTNYMKLFFPEGRAELPCPSVEAGFNESHLTKRRLEWKITTFTGIELHQMIELISSVVNHIDIVCSLIQHNEKSTLPLW